MMTDILFLGELSIYCNHKNRYIKNDHFHDVICIVCGFLWGVDFQSKFTINVFLVSQIGEEGEERSAEPRCVDGAAILTIPWAARGVTVTWTRSVCKIKYSLVKSPQRLQPPPINISFRLDFVSQTQWEEIVCHQERTRVRSHIQSHTHTHSHCCKKMQGEARSAQCLF